MTTQPPNYPPDTPRRARLIKEVFRHRCHEELQALGDPYLGSIAECSCGKQFIREDNQRDGRYWTEHRHEIYVKPGQPT